MVTVAVEAEPGEEFLDPKQSEQSQPSMLGGDLLQPSREAKGWMTGTEQVKERQQ